MVDHELNNLLIAEEFRQKTEINLIASENYASAAVLRAAGSVLTNKYAEGYPGKRYYAGCSTVDAVEQLAIDRCKELFQTEYVNVQPHSGSSANMAAYFALINPGDTIMGMDLAAGGHLTHGHGVSFSGTLYKSVTYGVDPETELLNYETIADRAFQHRPKLIVAGASAYSRSIDFAKFKAIADSVGALFMADIAHIAGLIAVGLHQSPIPYADVVTSTTHKTLRGPRGGLIMGPEALKAKCDRSVFPGLQGGPGMHTIAAKAAAFHEALQPEFIDYQIQVLKNARAMAHAFNDLGYRIVADGTDNHLFIVDLRSKNITGHAAQQALEAAGITVSKSCIPFDPAKPWITSGIRIGTPAITTRGMREAEAQAIVHMIDDVIMNATDSNTLHTVRTHVANMMNSVQL